MAGLSSLGIVVSGMKAAQAGLYVTGHNVANVATPGYSRQQPLQQDFLFNTLGYNATGPMQLGLGTDVSMIRQLRDKFMDQSYRGYATKSAFYDVKYNAGVEVESILNELEGQYKFQSILADLYNSIQELSKDPAAMDTRANFIASCIAFIEKANDTAKSLYNYQKTLNDAVKDGVKDLNRLANEIFEYNNLIATAEAAGDNANDFRDKRNVALDELSRMANITYKEQPNGTVDVLIEGNELVVNGLVHQVGLRYTAPGCEFVEPVFTTEMGILDYDPYGNLNARPLFNLSKTVTSSKGNDNGGLKALLVARGTQPADYTWGLSQDDPLFALSPMDKNNPYDPAGVNPGNYQKYNDFNKNALIPSAQIQLDTLVHGVVQLINQTFAGVNPVTGERPYSPYDNTDPPNVQGVEIFTRKPVQYHDTVYGTTPESSTDYYSLYTIGNIIINPEVLNPGGYYKIATALALPDGQGGTSKDMSDNTVVLQLLETWTKGFLSTDGGQELSVSNYYRHILTQMSEETNEAKSFVESQAVLLENIGYFRDAMMGVSMDEEMTNMMKYQHAYNAAARMVNVIDMMLDKIINGTGRVGL